MKKKQERQYKYKENSTFYLIDTLSTLYPIRKCRVTDVKPKWYPF